MSGPSFLGWLQAQLPRFGAPVQPVTLHKSCQLDCLSVKQLKAQAEDSVCSKAGCGIAGVLQGQILYAALGCLTMLAQPHSPSEAHVAVFTRKHRAPWRLSVPTGIAVPVVPSPMLGGELQLRRGCQDLRASVSCRRGKTLSQCWHGNHTISHIWEEPDLLVSCHC